MKKYFMPLLLLLLMGMVQGAMAQVPYAVLSDDGQTVTFYYDKQQASRSGVVAINHWTAVYQYNSATTAVFDASFADYRPTSTYHWFFYCSQLTTITGIENLKTENVTDMSYMFYNCSSLTSLDLSSLNTDNVTNMRAMFNGCYGLTNLDLSGFNTEEVTDMSYMFYNCSGLTNLNLSGFNTANVKDMSYMFQNCKALTKLDVSGFNTANVTNMEKMFYKCSGLTCLDLTGFNTGNVTNITYMFSDCSSLTTIYASDKWSTRSVEYVGVPSNMFSNCRNLVGGRGTTYHNVPNTSFTYARIDGGKEAPGFFTDGRSYAVLSDDNTVLTFYYDNLKASRNGMGILPFASIGSEVSWYPQHETITTVVFDKSFANNTSFNSTFSWFINCSKLTTITGIENLKTDNVESMEYMFSGCSSLTSLDLSGFKTENVTYMNHMFSGCSSLTSLDLSGFKTDNVIGMSQMFEGCSSLTSLDLSSFKTGNVTSMEYMFFNCRSMKTIYVGDDWSADNVLYGNNMFYNCWRLIGGQGTAFSFDYKDHTYAHIDGGTANPGYLTSINMEYNDVTLTAKSYTRVYGDANPMFEYTVSDGTVTSGTPTITCSATATSPVGTYDIVISKGTVGNNGTVNLVKGTLTITKAPLTISAGNYNKVEGEDNPVFTPTFSGFKNNETKAVLTKQPVITTTATKTSKAGNYTVSVSGAEAQNYSISYQSGTLTVTASGTPVTNPEPYAVLSDNNTVLTFYYDGNKASRSGMSVGPFNGSADRGWNGQCTSITTAVFDSSIANCTTLTSTSRWFEKCSNLTTISGIENLKTESVTDMSMMFCNCSSLTSIDVSKFNTEKVTNMNSLFNGCSKLTFIDVSKFNTEKVTSMHRMFYDCRSLTYLNVSGFKTQNVTEMSGMFYQCYNLTNLDVSRFDTRNVIYIDSMFDFCSSLTSLDVSGFKTDKAWNMFAMFRGCKLLTNLDVSGFNTSNVQNMNSMFQYCENLSSLDVRGFNTSKVTDMQLMFESCKKLTDLDVSNFTNENVKDLGYMFQYCKELTSINLGRFTNNKVENMGRMFSGCSNLKTIYVGEGNWNMENVLYGDRMFDGCTNLRGGNGTTYSSSKIDFEYARIDKIGTPGYLTGIYVEKDDVTLTAMSYTREYGKPNPMFEYTVSDGTVTSGTPTITCSATATSPVGTYDIVISKGTVGNKGTVNLVKGTLTITKAPLTIAAGNYTKEEGEDNPVFTPVFSGFKNNETKAVLTKQPTITTTATKTSKAGSYPVTVSGAEAQNYSITYENGTLIVTEKEAPKVDVTLTAMSYTREYGEANPMFEYTVSDGTITSGTPTITCSATTTSPVGTYDIVISKGTVGNNGTVNLVKGTLTITKAPLTIAAGNYMKEEGEDNPEFTPVFNGFKNGETKDVLTKQPTITTTATKASKAGNYPVTISGAEAQNYEITYEPGTLTVTEPIVDVTLTAMSYTREYGKANPMFEYTVSDGTVTSGTPTITCSATATSPVGTYDIVISKGTVSNKGTVKLVKGTLTITKAPLTISVGDYTKEEGEDNPGFTPVFSGFKNNETEDVLTKQPIVTTTATKDSPAGIYEVTVSGAEAQNYSISYQSGTLTVTEKPVELEAIEGESTMNTNALDGQDLSDNVVGNIYYVIGENGYDATDQSIVISQTTNMGQIAVKEPGSKDVRDNFNGMILKVAKGKGLITVNVKTSGNAQLVVQVGNGTPMLASKTEKGDVVFSYDVEEDTYVYIYAIIGSSAAKGYGLNATDTDSSVRIYSITVSPGVTGIRSVMGRSTWNDDIIYDLRGRRVETPAKGIYIIGGQKVGVK